MNEKYGKSMHEGTRGLIGGGVSEMFSSRR